MTLIRSDNYHQLIIWEEAGLRRVTRTVSSLRRSDPVWETCVSAADGVWCWRGPAGGAVGLDVLLLPPPPPLLQAADCLRSMVRPSLLGGA